MPEKFPVIETGKFRNTTAHYVVTNPDRPSRHDRRKAKVLALRAKRKSERLAREKKRNG